MMQLNINSIKTCKREDLIPTFVKVKVGIKHGTPKLKGMFVRAAMDTEMIKKVILRNKFVILNLS